MGLTDFNQQRADSECILLSDKREIKQLARHLGAAATALLIFDIIIQ